VARSSPPAVVARPEPFALFALLVLLALLLATVAAFGATGCGQECCTVDSFPIPVARAPLGQGATPGAMLASAQPPGGGTRFSMVVDTASPVTILAGPASGTLEIQQRGFDLLDATVTDPQVRARFRDIGLFQLPLGPVGDAATVPGGVVGGDLMHAFSIELRFAAPCSGADPDAGAAGPGCSSVTFWRHQGASLEFLEDAGYAVLRFTPFGGGETTASSRPDFLGLQGPVTLPPTRVVLRACAAPQVFSRTEPRELCCKRGDEIALARGADLSLLLATGVGPMVLSHSAWMRVAAMLTTTPAMTTAPLLVATWPTPIDAEWTTIPRFALVDGFDPPSSGDEGPCVDLGRARRIEWTAGQTATQMQQPHPAVSACVQPCDTDPSQPSESLNSAAYIELGGAVPVAVVDDAEPFLQALRFDIRPEGPDIDGLVGAGALGAARLEVDYLSDTPRAIFSCETNATPDTCYAASRCPRLPDGDHLHLCFGLPAHGLPATCAPSGCN
jgi:hypothetical protein